MRWTQDDVLFKGRHSERSKDSVQKLTKCQVLDGVSLSEIQSISVAYNDLNKES